MSKEAALSMLTGSPVTQTNPSIVAGATPPAETKAPVEPVQGLTEGQEVKPEAPKEEKGLDSDRFANLMKKEQQIVHEKRMISEDKKKLAAVQKQIEEFRRLKDTDLVAALKQIEISEEDIFNHLAGKQPEEKTPDQKAAELAQLEIQKFRDEMAAKEQAELKARDEKAIAGYKSAITDTIAKEAEKYEFITHYGAIAEDMVYETILKIAETEQDFNPHEVMKEVLDLYEDYYLEDDKAKSAFKSRQAYLEELRAKQEPPPLATGNWERKPPPVRERTLVDKPVEKSKPMPTITQKATATVASTIPRPETRSEKKERLANILRNSVLTR